MKPRRRPALALVVVAAISACAPLTCKNGRHTDPVLCGSDLDCSTRYGDNGNPDPLPPGCPSVDDPYAADAFEQEFLDACWGTPG